ncbi:hypothetical protein [Streptomyces adustus]|uniref:hypothetical protein n=1 Tax=Streptomyces adustus TaxID=1609272 RepID=UPI0037196B7F
MIPRPAPTRPAYLRLVRASAWYDLVVTAGFATPWTYALVHDVLDRAGDRFGWGTLPPLDPTQTMYANLMGSLVLVWSALRLLRPLAVHGLFDGFARVLFAAWEAYALAHGATRVLWLFLGVEVAFGVLQLVPWWSRRPGPAAGRDDGPVFNAVGR